MKAIWKRLSAFVLSVLLLSETFTGVFAQALPAGKEASVCYAAGKMQAAAYEMDFSKYTGALYDASELAAAKRGEAAGPAGAASQFKASAVYADEWDKYSSNYFYNQMGAAEKEFWDALDAMCLTYLKKKQDLSVYEGYYLTDYVYTEDLDLDSVVDVAQIFRYSNPQYYFLEPLMWYMTYGKKIGICFIVYDEFGKGGQRAQATKKFKSAIDSWTAQLGGYTTDYDKAKAVHDLICANVSYNYDVLGATGIVDAQLEQTTFTQSAYSAFCIGVTVCAGYSQAFELLCNGIGVDAAVVTSSDHEWNKVRLENSWYNVDCTWDDQQIQYYEFFARSDYAYDNLLAQAASHQEEGKWKKYLPKCTLDSASSGNTAGALPVITESTEPVTVTAEPVYKKDKTSGEKYLYAYKVTLNCATPDAVIYYTTDGTTPSEASGRSTRYKKPFTANDIRTLSAIAVCDKKYDSGILRDESCAAPAYAIHYETNGGKNSADNPKEYRTTDKTIKLKDPTKKGYKFNGWHRTKNFGSSKVKQIKAGSNGVLYLYAEWTPITYKIVYDGNKATSGSMSGKKCTYGKSYTLADNKFKRDGYTFAGWNTQADGKGKSYKNKAAVKNLTAKSKGTVTLYAQWKK